VSVQYSTTLTMMVFLLGGPAFAVADNPEFTALKDELRWVGDYGREGSRQKARFLFGKHCLRFLFKKKNLEAELLRAATSGKKLGWEWRLLLVAGSARAKIEFAKWYAIHETGFDLRNPAFASRELSAALLPYLKKSTVHPNENALRALAAAPIPAAISYLEAVCLNGRSGTLSYGALGLGNLGSPEALAALERCGLKHGWLYRALSLAIASFGNDGVKALRRIYNAGKTGSHRGVFIALTEIATPGALRLAEEIAAQVD
jgi:hypothetical protein